MKAGLTKSYLFFCLDQRSGEGLHVVFGAYQGGIDAKPGERVIFIGDCAAWQGEIAGDFVKIESVYKDRSTKDPHTIKHDDIYAKMATTTAKMKAPRSGQVVRLEGCPVSVAEQLLALVAGSDIKNPFFDPKEMINFNRGYLSWRGRTALNRIMGKRYQQHGAYDKRGAAAPDVKS